LGCGGHAILEEWNRIKEIFGELAGHDTIDASKFDRVLSHLMKCVKMIWKITFLGSICEGIWVSGL